jgi:hypothetical protein
MYVKLYDNQEATERSYLLLGLGALALGYGFLAFFCLYISLLSEDDDRIFEELEVDIVDEDLHFNMNVQKDIALESFSRERRPWSQRRISDLHDYLAEDAVYERDMLHEIYELPLSIIISNNYYLVPADEHQFSFFHAYLRESL